MRYKVLTRESVLDYEEPLAGSEYAEDYEENWREELWEEQLDILEKLGYNFYDNLLIKYLDSDYRKFDITSIDDAIQHLAIKDGVDLVKFSDGHIGFVAYYNNCEDAFKILADAADLGLDTLQYTEAPDYDGIFLMSTPNATKLLELLGVRTDDLPTVELYVLDFQDDKLDNFYWLDDGAMDDFEDLRDILWDSYCIRNYKFYDDYYNDMYDL